MTSTPPLVRRLLAEFLGTGLLITTVVGSGIFATELSPNDVGLQLLENALVTGLALTCLILMFGPISGAHFNPCVTAADWFLGRRAGTGPSLTDLGAYIVVQCVGGIAGAALANAMFSVPQGLSHKDRSSAAHFLSEIVATAVLLLLIFALVRTQRGAPAAPAVGAIVAAGYWFTSSTFFANPAADVGRMFSDTFAGIDPRGVPLFLGGQLLGLIIGIAVVLVLYPDVAEVAGDVVLPHQGTTGKDA